MQVLALFGNLIRLIFDKNTVKGFRATKIFKEIKFEGRWDELESKIGLPRQSGTKHLRLTLVYNERVHYGKILISIFQEFFPSIRKKTFFL